jgi:hypothetical protein
MGNKKTRFIISFLTLAFLVALLSCAIDKAPLHIEKSLPQSELEYYNDSFDKIRDDFWDRAGYLWREEQIQNFKLADMRFENGKLFISTKTGSFSKGGLASKYAFRGDFDIQLDCRINFLKGTSGMDQLLNFLVIDKSGKIGKASVVVINLTMGEGSYQGWLGTGALINGRWNKGGSQKIENFDGTLRILRKGKNISTLYKKKRATAWNKMHTFRANDNDLVFGFQVRNFFNKRTTIRATQSISAEFDSFRINAAQEIIEEEI